MSRDAGFGQPVTIAKKQITVGIKNDIIMRFVTTVEIICGKRQDTLELNKNENANLGGRVQAGLTQAL